MAKKEVIIIELDFDTSDFTKDAAKLNSSIKELNNSQKALKKSGDEGSIQFQKNATALRENKKELRETNKSIDQLNTANKSTAGSNEQLRAQLSVLTKEYNGLSQAERENGARGKELNSQINQTTDTLKENEEGIGDNRRSVGDYGKALGGTPFGSFIGGIKSMGAAFLANPIGLIVTAIVLALKALFEAFKSTEEGENKIAKATAIVSTVFSKLFDALEPLASFLVDVLGAAFSFIIKQINKAADELESTLEFFGFGEAAEGLKSYRGELEQVAKSAALIADARAKTDKLDRELIVQTAKVHAQASDAREKALDSENLSAEERNKLLNDSAAAIDELAAKEEKSATIKLKALQLENSLTNSNKEALDAQAEAEAELFNVQKARSDAQKSLARDQLRVENEIKKAQTDRVKARQDGIKKEIDATKLALNFFIESQGIRAKTLNEQLKISEQVAQKELDILKRELDAKLISREQYDLAVLEIQNELLEKQTEAVVENAQRELDIITETNQSKLDANQFLTDELFIQEQERINNQLQLELDFQKLRLEQGVISEQEYQDAIKGVKDENAAALKTLNEEKAADEAEAKIIDIENQRALDETNFAFNLEASLERFDTKTAEERKKAEAAGADLVLFDKKIAKERKEIEKQVSNNKLALASQTFGNLAEIAGKESAAGKAFAIAQTTIDTFVGAQAAFNSLASIPIVGTVLGAIAAAAAVAGGIGRVNKIKNTKTPKAAKGGIFGGNLHSSGGNTGYFQDGTVVEVERGELFAVVNRNSTGMINDLSSLNEAGGGVSFGMGGTKSFLQDGGIGINNASGGVDSENDSSLQLISAVESLPAPVVIVQDINEVQGETVAVEQRAIL